MSRERLYIWILAIAGGLIFIFSNLFWLLPFIEDVERAAERYQLEIARRVSTQTQFFLEKRLRELSLLVVDILEVNVQRAAVEKIEKKFLERHPEFLTVSLTPSQLPPDQYFLGPVERQQDLKTILIKVPLIYADFDLKTVVDLSEVVAAVSQERIGRLGRVRIFDGQGNLVVGETRELGPPGKILTATIAVPGLGWQVLVEDPIIEAHANKFKAIRLAAILILVGMAFVAILVWSFRKILMIALRERQLHRAKSEYLALMAHQLRTPLAATKWNIKTLLDADWGPLTKKQKKFLERSYESNEQMVKLVDDLLNIIRIEEGRFGYKFVKTDLAQLLEKLVTGFRQQAKQARVVLFFRRSKKPLPKVSVDPEKLNMALSNLLDNAIRYNHPQGKVEVNLEKINNQFRIAVKDTGVGIPAKQMNRLFSKFFRADNVVKLQVAGFGLGLYIVKNIIDRHGGQIAAESKEGQGSIFTVVLPLR